MDFLLGDELMLVMRWLHFLAGITWIGLLYYFNFVQGPFFAEIDAQTKNVAITKLVPRALWWFRWGAMFTFIAGLYIIMARGHMAGFAIYSTSWGLNILIGALLGTMMFLNVWFIIWPNQKIVIQSATQVLGGGAPLPNAAASAAKAGLASRHNVLFSVPMLLFMGMASHFSYTVNNLSGIWLSIFIIVLGLELNAIKGKMGPLTSVKGVVTCGFILAAVMFAVVKLLTT